MAEKITIQKKALFWCIGFGVLVSLLYLLSSIMLPFAAGLVLAYFLDPLVDRLETWKIPRMAGTILVIGIFIFSFILSLMVLMPLMYENLQSFMSKLPSYAQKLQALLTEKNKQWLSTIMGGQVPDVSKNVGEIVSKGVAWLTTFLQGLLAGGAAIVNIISLLVVTPVVTFYFLYDWDRIITKIDSLVPPRAQEEVRAIGRDVDKALSGFIRGQALVCLTLGLFYGISLNLAGLNYGFTIGMITGFISFIPYVGAMVGLLLSLGVAIVQFYPSYTQIAIVAGIFAVGQFLEGNVLSPKFVGESVGLHPVWLMFALFAFGALFGFVGLLIAVPLAAIVGVMVRFGLQKYLQSPLYLDKK